MLAFEFFLVLVSVLSAKCINFGKEYNFEETFLIEDGGNKNIGFQVKGFLRIELLKKDFYLLKLENPKLYISSNKVNEYLPHSSNIDSYQNDPFLIEISDGIVKNIFITRDDDKRIVNIKRAISNLLQFKTINYQGEETDLSGTCIVNYKVDNSNYIIKTKENCIPLNSAASNSIWGGEISSNRKSSIYLDNNIVASIISWEEHFLKPNLSDMIKANFTAKVEIRLVDSELLKEKFPSENLKDITTKIEADLGKMFEIYDVTPDKEDISCKNCPRFSKVISEQADYLEDKSLGSSKSAEVFMEAVKAARRSSADEVYRVINAKKNRKLQPQLMDILGAAQTINTQKAALKFLKINTEKYNLNLCERYLWSLSMSPIVHQHTVEELQKLVENKPKNIKLWNTLLLTLSAVVNKYSHQEKYSEELVVKTVDFLCNELKDCTDDECQQMYVKALSNIPNERTLPVLFEIIKNTQKKVGGTAMRVISRMDPKLWNKNVIKLAELVLFSNETFDSSTRLFAIDILLRAKPTSVQLSRLLSILKQKDKSRELKEYLLQRLAEISESCNSFKKLLKKLVIETGINDYDAFSQGGLSTSFSRSFMNNGILSTSQEIVGGVLKQGSVNINLIHNGGVQTPFMLGIFAGGLSSFISSDEDSVDDEIATAGLELTVLDVELRKFVFFNGTGELMGQVWSGTGSDLTPAYQAILMLEDSKFSVPMSTGDLLNIRLEAAASVDLSGKIEISLWNRNAKSLVRNRVGVLIQNSVTLSASYIDANINIDINTEPELHLTADLDFSSGSTLCLKLQQPKILVRWNSHKSESIPGTNHRSSRSRHLILPVHGRTYSLNAKNNEMCNKVFNN